MRINSILTKFLTLNLGVAVVLALSLLAAMTYAVNSALTLQTRHNLASYQRSIDAELDDLRREFQGQAAALARNPAFAQALARKDAGAVRAFLLQAREQPLCDLATATDAAGIVIARGHALNVGDSMRGNSLYAAALPGSNAAAGVASSGIEAGAVYPLNLQAVHPVVLDGEQVGVVSLGYNLAGNSFVDTIHTRLGVTCSIYKGTTRVATTLTDNGQRAVGVTLENPEVLHTVLRQGQSLETRNTVYDTEYDTLFWPLRDAQGSMVGMFVMGTPRHAAQAMEQGILLAVLGIGAAALVVVTGLSALFARRMTRPLATATQFAAQVAAGDLRQTLTVAGGDEIGHLADALRTMVAELKRRLAFAQGVLEGVSNGSPCAFTNPDGNIAYINDKIVALAGREGPPESFHGMPMNVFMNRDISKGTPSVEALHSGQRVERQVQLPNALGGARVVNVTANPVRDLDGNLSGVFTLYYDLTQLVAQQEALAQANANIQRVAGEACRMAEVVSSASSQIAAQVEQTTKGADMQAARVQETSASMQQMTATVMDVARSAAQASSNTDAATQTARRGEAVVQEVVEAIGKMHGQMTRLNESMDTLGSRAQGIGQVLTTIKDIADQTNLLALNAAIEAARAGDAGRGFAVVADEVRKLAEKTVAATQEVETAVMQIQLGVHSTVQATSAARTQVEEAITLAERSGASLHEIVSIVENASAQVQAIAAASEEQSAATEEIARVIEEVRHIAEEMYAGMNKSSTAVSSLATQAVALQQLTTELHQ